MLIYHEIHHKTMVDLEIVFTYVENRHLMALYYYYVSIDDKLEYFPRKSNIVKWGI